MLRSQLHPSHRAALVPESRSFVASACHSLPAHGVSSPTPCALVKAADGRAMAACLHTRLRGLTSDSVRSSQRYRLPNVCRKVAGHCSAEALLSRARSLICKASVSCWSRNVPNISSSGELNRHNGAVLQTTTLSDVISFRIVPLSRISGVRDLAIISCKRHDS